MKPENMTIQMTAFGKYFPVVLFIMQYNAALTFECVHEILKCERSKATEKLFSVILFIYAVHCGFIVRFRKV